jgi:hypothetical protein
VVCEFNPLRHTYVIVIKGRRYKVPSVTRITSIVDKSAPLMAWAINQTLDICKGAIAPGTEYAESYLAAVWDAAKKQSRNTKSDAAERGKRLHRAIEAGFEVGEDEQSRPLVTSIRSFLETKNLRILQNEGKIYSRRYRYSGTFDAIADADGKFYLLDWKSGKSSTYPEYRLQTAGYVHAREEEYPDQPIEGRYLIRIGEEGILEPPHYFPRSTQRLDFKAFRGALDLFRRVQQIEKESRKSSNKLLPGGI